VTFGGGREKGKKKKRGEKKKDRGKRLCENLPKI